jgi:aquaporin Z
MPLSKRLTAEFLGTLWLVFGGCGAAVFATGYPTLGIQFFGVALAFGLTVVTGAYALGHVSGAHFNPAVSVGLWAAKRFPAKELLPYVIAQVLGAIAAAGLIYLIATGKAGLTASTLMNSGFAANGFENTAGSPGAYSPLAAFIAEVVTTFFFLIVILGSTSKLAPTQFAPLAIGLCLTLIHLITIPVTNTSVNPARSTGPAVFVAAYGSSWAVSQLWLFWVAPILGALLAGFFFTWFSGEEVVETKDDQEPNTEAEDEQEPNT